MKLPPLLSIMAGFALWSVLFLLLYGAQATGCHLAGGEPSAMAGPYPALRWTLMVLAALGTTAVMLLSWKKRTTRPDPSKVDDLTDFTREVSRYVWLGAAVATPFTFIGVISLSLCGT